MEFFYNPTWNPAQSLMVATLPKDPPISSFSSSNEVHELHPSDLRKIMDYANVFESQISTFVASPGANGTVMVTVGNLTCSAFYSIAYVLPLSCRIY
jgi:hypothetical protein